MQKLFDFAMGLLCYSKCVHRCACEAGSFSDEEVCVYIIRQCAVGKGWGSLDTSLHKPPATLKGRLAICVLPCFFYIGDGPLKPFAGIENQCTYNQRIHHL